MLKSEVKSRAEQFCKENNINTCPVEIVKVCKENGLEVFEEYLGPDVSGMIVVDDKEWEGYNTNQFISVNLAESAVRRRFSIAHELAHFVLHRNGSKLYAHRDFLGKGTIKSRIEQEANYFAANILMPEELVKEKVEEIKDNVWGVLPSFVLIREIADNFVVSESAAEVRLKQLGIL